MNDSNVHYWLQGTWGKRKVLYSLHVFTPWGSIKGLAISLSNASEVLDSEDGSRVLGEECKVRGEGFCEAWIVCSTVHYRYSGSGNRTPINPTQRQDSIDTHSAQKTIIHVLDPHAQITRMANKCIHYRDLGISYVNRKKVRTILKEGGKGSMPAELNVEQDYICCILCCTRSFTVW